MRSEQEMLDMVRGKVVRLRRRRRIALGSGAVLALALVVGGGVSLAAAAGRDDDSLFTYTADQPPPPSAQPPPPSTQPPPPPSTEAPPPSGETIVMPNVIGMDATAATTVLQEVGLRGGTRAIELRHTATAEVPPGTVLAQSPAAGTDVRLGDPVVLDVSSDG
jgi:hypothetical protein